MMNAFTVAVRDRLVTDANLTAMLTAYKTEPAVFTVEPVPGDAVLPYIVTVGHVSDVPFDTFGVTGREINRDIRCYTKNSGSMFTLSAILDRVRFLFHRHRLSIVGHENIMTTCLSTTTGLDDDESYGGIVTIRALIV